MNYATRVLWATSWGLASMTPVQVDAACTAPLSGVVINVGTLEPVSDVVVRAVPSTDGSSLQWGAVTSADGSFSMSVPCDAWVELEFSKAGFVPHAERFRVDRDGAQHDIYLLPGEAQAVSIQGHAIHDAELHPRAAHVLDDEDLQEVRGRDLAGSLRELPGISVLGSGAVSKPIIHGLTVDRLLILQDGVRLESQDWGLDHQPEVDPFGAHTITVTKGADAVRYGPGAIGGVIALEPAPYPEEPSVVGVGNTVAIVNGRGGAGNASVQTRFPGGADAWAARAQFSYRRVGASDAPDYVLDNTGEEVLGFSAGVAWDPNPRTRIEISGRGYRSKYGVFTDISVSNFDQFEFAFTSPQPQNVELFGFDYDFDRPFAQVEHYQGKISFTFELSDKVRFESFYSYQFDDRREFEIVRGSLGDSAQGAFDLGTHFLDAHLDVQLGDWSVEGGMLLTAAFNDYEGVRFIPDYEKWGAAAYGIVHLYRPSFEIEAGVRVDFETFDTIRAGVLQGVAGGPRTQLPDEINRLNYFNVVGSLGGVYRWSNGLSLRGQVASAVRNPAPNELFADGPTVGTPGLQIGDPDLDPEITVNPQATLQYESRRVRAEATGYAQFIPGYIYLVPAIDENGEPILSRQSRGDIPAFNYLQVDALFYGADLDLTLSPVRWFELRATGALVRARDIENDSFLVYVPPDNLRIRGTLRLTPIDTLRSPYLYGEGLLVRRQTRFDINADFTPPPDGYALLNAGAGVGLNFGRREIYLDIEGTNLLNQTYRNYLSRLRYFADEPGVEVFIRLTIPFQASL